METIFTTENLTSKEVTFQENVLTRTSETNLVYANLLAEGGENFYEYLQSIELSSDPDMILLPSLHHYYYDIEDLKEVKTIVNLKELNKIKQPKDFLKNIFHILPHSSCFIGAFVDGKNQLGFFPNSSSSNNKSTGIDPIENGISSRIPFLNMIYDIMDAKTNRFLTRRTVATMLEEVGFRILDMTEIKGITYFSVRKGKSSTE
jgi:hypothetical protein